MFLRKFYSVDELVKEFPYLGKVMEARIKTWDLSRGCYAVDLDDPETVRFFPGGRMNVDEIHWMAKASSSCWKIQNSTQEPQKNEEDKPVPGDLPNKTKADAFQRLTDARSGCMIGPTEEYLLELRRGLYDWIKTVEEGLDAIWKEERERKLRLDEDD